MYKNHSLLELASILALRRDLDFKVSNFKYYSDVNGHFIYAGEPGGKQVRGWILHAMINMKEGLRK